MSEKEILAMSEEEKKKRAELDLLVDADGPKAELGEDARRDPRFRREEDLEFALDPTHKEYRKVVQGHNKVSSKRRRQ